MKVAVSTWSDRISSVLDVAQHLLLVEAEDGHETARRDVPVEADDLGIRAKRIAQLGPEVLICGAVSQPFETMLSSAGIRLIPHKCGPVEEILQAFLSGKLTDQAFAMPGCCGRRQQQAPGRCRRGHRWTQAKGEQES